MDNPLTLQEAKDQVAKTYCGMPNIPYASWKDMENALCTTLTGALNLLARTEEAAKLWCLSERKRTWDEACEAQRDLCIDSWELGFIPTQAPKPEFKP